MEQKIGQTELDEKFGNDRRVEPRYAANLMTDVTYLDEYAKEETTTWAKVVNISRDGVSLVSERPIVAGTEVKLNLGISKKAIPSPTRGEGRACPERSRRGEGVVEILAQGKIIWTRWLEERKESCYGVVLLKFGEEEQAVFKEFFKDHSAVAVLVERRQEERRIVGRGNVGAAYMMPEEVGSMNRTPTVNDGGFENVGLGFSPDHPPMRMPVIRDDKEKTDQRKAERRKQLGIFKKAYAWYKREKEWKSQGLFYFRRIVESPPVGRCVVEGRPVIMFSSNNYLGLSVHPKVVEAAIKAIKEFGTTSGGTPLLVGTTKLHILLEEKLAEFKNTESAVFCSAGYLTNIALISPLIKKDDAAIIDEKNHASSIDGCRLSFASMRIYAHNNMVDLKNKLKSYNYKTNKLIVTDGLFSMDGDFANLSEICRLAEQYHAVVMVDESHDFGVVGKNARGSSEYFKVENKIDLFMGTFSKALAAVGGFITGKKELVSFIRHISIPFMFSSTLPASVCGSIIAALEVIKEEPELRLKLWENANFLRKGLQDIGFNTGLSQSYIIPVIIGDETKMNQITGFLYKNDIVVSPIVRPAVKRNSARLRISVNATHTREDLEKTLDVFKKAYQKFEPFEIKES